MIASIVQSPAAAQAWTDTRSWADTAPLARPLAASAESRLYPLAGTRHGGLPLSPRGAASGFPLGDIADVAPLPDGGFLVAGFADEYESDDPRMVLRVDRFGQAGVLAGGKPGFSGDGGPASLARFRSISDISVAADGGVLVADSCRVRRIAPAGIVTTVAGRRPEAGGECGGLSGTPVGDGGPATLAVLSPWGVAASPDGGFLVADGSSNRVRRVSPAGTITTVAGGGPALPYDDYPAPGRKATAGELASPDRVGARRDGGFMFKDQYGAYRVLPDGTFGEIFRNMSSDGAGGFTVGIADDGIVYRRGYPRGRLWSAWPGPRTLIAGGGPPAYFEGEGDLALGSELGGAFEAERTSAGDVLLVEPPPWEYSPRPSRVLLAASPDTPWLAVAVAHQSLRALLAKRLMFRLTRAAHVTFDLLAGQRRVARRSMAAHAGLNRVDLPRRVRPGLYRVRLRARDGQSMAGDDLLVLVGRRLPGLVAKSAVEEEVSEYGSIDYCTRLGPRRVGCEVTEFAFDDPSWTGCSRTAATLGLNGTVYLRDFACRKGRFRWRPAWGGRPRQSPSLDLVFESKVPPRAWAVAPRTRPTSEHPRGSDRERP